MYAFLLFLTEDCFYSQGITFIPACYCPESSSRIYSWMQIFQLPPVLIRRNA